jgi:hypothetical protein
MTKVVRLRASDRRDWKRQYRLAKERWCWQSVRLDHDDARMLRLLAKRQHTSVAELIRTFITWGLELHDGEIDYERDLIEE